MSDSLRELFEQQGAIAILNAYGLNQALTDQDDPELWASILLRHWPAPSDPDMYPPELRFGIRRIVSEGENVVVAKTRDGMEKLEIWCFERIDSDHLQAKGRDKQTAPSAVGVRKGTAMMLAALQENKPIPTIVLSTHTCLEVSRPSRNQKKALVHSGLSAPFSVRTGETRYWELQENGSWVEAEKTVSRRLICR